MNFLEWVVAAQPILLILSSAALPLLSAFVRRTSVIDLVAAATSAISLAISVYALVAVARFGTLVYRFGGFPPPLGIVYVVDEASATLGLLATFSLLLSVAYGSWILEPASRYLFYATAFLLVAGCTSLFYTADLFNLYVSAELTSISAYVLTSFYRSRGAAIRAASIYALSASLVLSLLLLSVFMLYGSYGTLNMADLALKSRNPGAWVPLSGTVFGDIVLASKVSLAIIAWLMIFKSAIVPNHFWLPGVYMEAPTPAVALFTASADIIGVYGAARLLITVFGAGTVFDGYRRMLLDVLLVIAAASALISSTLVTSQESVRRIVAYSTIAQYSLAFAGVVSGTLEGVAGAMLHLVANGLGDALVLYSAGIAAVACGRSLTCLSYLRGYRVAHLALIVGFLNLFGIIPLLPGFWSKALLTLAMVKAGRPLGAALVLAVSGLCAIGYFRAVASSLKPSPMVVRSKGYRGGTVLPIAVLLVLLVATISLGVLLLVSDSIRSFVVEGIGNSVEDYERYIRLVLGS